MTRVVAGSVGGRRLVVPRGRATRPTSDRAREGLFSALESMCGPLDGLHMLDLYAGSGAVGIEGLSRGAHAVCFVESDDVACGVIRANLAALGVAGGVVRNQRVETFIAGWTGGPAYDICFLDPPYAESTDRVGANLATLARSALNSDAVVVVERASKDEWTWPPAISAVRSRRYGDTTLWYGRTS
jgi:16S rRNA (guanine966-N2)-methyltransferase